MIEFKDVKVGDKLWSIQLGECEVVEKMSAVLSCKAHDGNTGQYFYDGTIELSDKARSLYWSKPEITGGGKPEPRKLYAYEFIDDERTGMICHFLNELNRDAMGDKYERRPSCDRDLDALERLK